METEQRPLFAIYKLSSDSENLSKNASADPEEKNKNLTIRYEVFYTTDWSNLSLGFKTYFYLQAVGI